jgi:hypothetical protein
MAYCISGSCDVITLQGRTGTDISDSSRQFLSGVHKGLICQAVNRLFATLWVGSGMARLLILLVIGAIAYVFVLPGPPAGTMPVDASVAAAAPAGSGLPHLDLLSLAVGLVAGFFMGWMWQLPWRTVPELFREVAFRSVRGVGLVGLAMGAAAILLFY